MILKNLIYWLVGKFLWCVTYFNIAIPLSQALCKHYMKQALFGPKTLQIKYTNNLGIKSASLFECLILKGTEEINIFPKSNLFKVP